METVLKYWPLVILGLVTVASILNAATRHFSEHSGARKVLGFVSEVLSILASAGVSSGLAKIKPPLTSRSPDA